MANPEAQKLNDTLKKLNHIPEKVLDIGANIGQFYILMKQMFPNCHVLAFEPLPKAVWKMKQMGCDNVVEIAVSDKTGEFSFYAPKPSSKGASFYAETHSYETFTRNKITVKTETLDNLVDEAYDLIKIDVQGSEYDVIMGGPKTIAKAKTVLMECGVTEYNKNAPSTYKIIEAMKDLGFYPHHVMQEHTTKADPNTIVQVDLVFTKQDVGFDVLSQYNFYKEQ